MYLDMVTRNNDWTGYKGYRFMIMDFRLFTKDASLNEVELIKMNLLIEFYNVSITYYNGRKIHLGTIYLGLDPIGNANTNEIIWSEKLFAKAPFVTLDNEIQNEGSDIFYSPEAEEFGLFSWLSPQPLNYKVN
jgi:hypothetical protein